MKKCPASRFHQNIMKTITELPTFSFLRLLQGAGRNMRDRFPVFFDGTRVNRYCWSGRAAIFHAFKALHINPPGEVLMPAYHCGAEVASVGSTGLTPVFYRVFENLSVDFSNLESRITKQTKALYLTHFFGFPGPAEKMADIADKHRLALIEDCAPSLFARLGSNYVGTFGHAAIFSLTKTLPCPDGGLLSLRPDDIKYRPKLSKPPLKKNCRNLRKFWMRVVRRQFRAPEKFGADSISALRANSRQALFFEPSSAEWAASFLTSKIVKLTRWQAIVSLRRKNYNYLAERIEPICGDEVRLLMPDLPGGAVPWILPLITRDPLRKRAFLRKHGIGAVAVWTYVHPGFDRVQFPESARLKSSVLGLPIHQDLTEADMDYIANCIRSDYLFDGQ